MDRIYPAITVTKKATDFIRRGHVWIYKEEITDVSGLVENGCLADVFSQKGSYLGTGIFSEKSKIAVRIISDNPNDKFDEAFWERRLRYAYEYRKQVMQDGISACRLVFGEADRFPGLTVDRFNNLLSVQTLSYGMDQIKNTILSLLVKILREDGQTIDGVFERNDVKIRLLEGLPEEKGWMKGFEADSAITKITENGIIYEVDVENGQKTGFFLDQKENRRAVASIAKGRTVLDCFTHTGSFALNAAKGGAQHITAVDISDEAVEMCKNNVRLNNFEDKFDFIKADVFDLLPRLEKESKYRYDFIILDPPAFTKSRNTATAAAKGYKEINYRAMKILPRGGYLATCSCSHFMETENFLKAVLSAASDAKVTLRQIESRQQAPDHPILPTVPETDYLKFFLFQVI